MSYKINVTKNLSYIIYSLVLRLTTLKFYFQDAVELLHALIGSVCKKLLHNPFIHITTLFELILMADKEQTTYHYQSKSQTNPNVYLLDYKKSPKLKTLKP